MVAIVIDLWIGLAFMSSDQIRFGLIAGALVFIYLGYVHLIPSRHSRSMSQRHRFRLCPKEVLIGVVFAFGVALPIWQFGLTLSSLVSVGLVSSLFAANCSLVGLFECDLDRGQQFESIATSVKNIHRTMSLWIGAGVILPLLMSTFEIVPVAIAVAVSASYLSMVVILKSPWTQQSEVSPGVVIDASTIVVPACLLMMARWL